MWLCLMMGRWCWGNIPKVVYVFRGIRVGRTLYEWGFTCCMAFWSLLLLDGSRWRNLAGNGRGHVGGLLRAEWQDRCMLDTDEDVY